MNFLAAGFPLTISEQSPQIFSKSVVWSFSYHNIKFSPFSQGVSTLSPSLNPCSPSHSAVTFSHAKVAPSVVVSVNWIVASTGAKSETT